MTSDGELPDCVGRLTGRRGRRTPWPLRSTAPFRRDLARCPHPPDFKQPTNPEFKESTHPEFNNSFHPEFQRHTYPEFIRSFTPEFDKSSIARLPWPGPHPEAGSVGGLPPLQGCLPRKGHYLLVLGSPRGMDCAGARRLRRR